MPNGGHVVVLAVPPAVEAGVRGRVKLCLFERIGGPCRSSFSWRGSGARRLQPWSAAHLRCTYRSRHTTPTCAPRWGERSLKARLEKVQNLSHMIYGYHKSWYNDLCFVQIMSLRFGTGSGRGFLDFGFLTYLTRSHW